MIFIGKNPQFLNTYSVCKKSVFIKIEQFLNPYKNALWALRPAKPLGVLSRHPCRNLKPLSRGERLCMLGWLCIVQSLWAYTPGVRAGAECGAALTKQGRLQSVAHSRCTTQRHRRLTTRIGATPKARMLWLLAKSYKQGRLCQLNQAVARCNGTNS